MAKTVREQNMCTVKERGDGTPFLFFELLRGPPMSAFPNTHFGLDLKPGVTHAEAKALASDLNDKLVGMFAILP